MFQSPIFKKLGLSPKPSPANPKPNGTASTLGSISEVPPVNGNKEAASLEHEKDEELLDFLIDREAAEAEELLHPSHRTQQGTIQVDGNTVITAITEEDKDNNTKTTTISKESPGKKETVVLSSDPAVKKASWFSRTKDNIKYSFISRETEAAFEEIEVLYDKLFADFPYNKIDFMIGLMMLADYYKRTPVLSYSRVQELETVANVRYYMRFASCCYGYKFIYGLLLKRPKSFLNSVVGAEANVKALCFHTKISPQDVVAARWTSSLYDPGHYVCLVHEKKSIVVAIRGSFHINDAITDLVASVTTFSNGSAHTGFLRTAMQKMQTLTPIILKCLEDYPTYQVVVVGHSLGAGVASLLTLLLHEAHPDMNLHCYAFAPPCVVTAELALSQDTRSLIDSIVLDDDVVPRLSFANINHLKEIIITILGHRSNTFQRAVQLIGGGIQEAIASKISDTRNNLSDLSVFPPGNVFHLVPRAKLETDNCTICQKSSKNGHVHTHHASDANNNNNNNNNPNAAQQPLFNVNISEKAAPTPATSTTTTSTAPTTTTTTTTTIENVNSDLSKISLSKEVTAEGAPGEEAEAEEHKAVKETLVSSVKMKNRRRNSFSTFFGKQQKYHTSLKDDRRSSLAPQAEAAQASQAAPSTPELNSKTNGAEKTEKPKKEKPPKPKKITGYIMEHSNPSLFHEIIVSPTMYGDHMPNKYEEALDSYLQYLVQQDLQSKSQLNTSGPLPTSFTPELLRSTPSAPDSPPILPVMNFAPLSPLAAVEPLVAAVAAAEPPVSIAAEPLVAISLEPPATAPGPPIAVASDPFVAVVDAVAESLIAAPANASPLVEAHLNAENPLGL